MRSLNAHLRDAETHDRLAFHPACPVCHQTRLSGTFSTAPAVSPRAQALVAVGALVVSAPAPAPVALAAEPDNQREGTVQVVDTRPGDPATSRDFDPGGQPTNLPEIATPPIPTDPPNDAGASADPSPSTDTTDPVIDPGEAAQAAAGQSTASQQTTTQGTAEAAPAPASPAATDNPPPPAPAATPDSTPPPSATEASAKPADAPRHDIDDASDDDQIDRHTQDRSRAEPYTVAPSTAASTTRTAAPASAAVTAEPAPDGRRARPGDRTHTVLPGESLWSIASDLLGPHATPARVAREVHRLWQLNHDRIATGDPDLIMIGTRLMLR